MGGDLESYLSPNLARSPLSSLVTPNNFSGLKVIHWCHVLDNVWAEKYLPSRDAFLTTCASDQIPKSEHGL